MNTCGHCGQQLGTVACKGDNDLYCSADCWRKAEPEFTNESWRSAVNWWVCIMVDRRGGHRGGHFAVGMWDKPEGVIQGERHSIAADSYEVVYGPCSEAEATEYMEDLSTP